MCIELYKDLKFTWEVKNLCSINERFDTEADDVKVIRISYANIMELLISWREEFWRSEAGRNYSIAITELENSCIRAVKAFYSHNL